MRLVTTFRVVTLGILCLLGGETLAQTAQPNSWFIQQRTYPGGIVSDQALMKALQQRLAIETRLRTLDADSPPPAPTPTWTQLGPVGVTSPEGPLSGRVTALATDPANPNHVFLAASGGGVWKSTDAGNSWTSLGDHLLTLSSGALTVDSRNGNIYYGTGDATLSVYGAGVLRSSDAGASWQQLSPQFNRGYIMRVALSAQDARTVFAARDTGLWRSDDAGDTWNRLLTGYASDVLVDPVNSQIVLAALGNSFGAQSNGVFMSYDGGASWSGVAGLPAGITVGRISLAKCAGTPAVVYALVARSGNFALDGLYRSDDHGANWRRASAPPNLFLNGRFSQGNQNNVVAVDPRSPDRVFVGGVELYRSLDGGNSWTVLSTGNGQRQIHEAMFSIAFRPGNPQTMYVATEGGVYRSDDGGDSWTNLNRGLPIAQFSGLAVSNGAAAVVGGTESHGIIRLSADFSVWDQLLRGDVGSVVIDPNNPNTVLGARPLIQPMRSLDGGASWNQVTQGMSLGDGVGYYPPLVNDPANARQLFFGTTRVYRSLDGGDNWSAISNTLTSGYLTAMSVPSGGRIVYVGASDGRVYTTLDLVNWVPGAGVPNRVITDITVDPRAPTRAFFTASGFGTGHVFRTQDGGVTWTDISGNLPDAPANSVVVDPNGVLYVATDVGVFRSEDLGGTWTSFNLGMPNTFVTALALDSTSSTLIAGTYGRGAFQVSLRPSGSAAPSILVRGVVNAASFSVPLAPGAMASIFGSGLARQSVANSSLPVAKSLGGTSVTVNGVAAPLFFVSPNQINFQFPFEVTGSGANVVVTTPDGSAAAFVPVAPAAPGVFVGTVAHAGGGPVDSSNPAVGGEILTMAATGLGPTTPAVASGVANPSVAAPTVLPVTVTMGGFAVSVQYAGLAPGQVALNQINIAVPPGLSGDVPLVVIVGGRASNVVTISVR